MSASEHLQQKLRLPLKSVAGALLFAIFLGPVGLLYATAWGGIIMIIVGFVIFSSKLWVPILLFWILCCVISVLATNRYNKKLIQ
jgi:hypothetical protein